MSHRFRILLVEDTLIDQLAVRNAVRVSGLPYDLTVVETVADASRALAGAAYDAVLTDYNLPDGTALDVLRLTGDVAAIIVTGTGDHERAAAALKAGVIDYLVKEDQQRHLASLATVVERAVRVTEQNRRLKMLVHALTQIGEAVYVSAPDESIVFVNRAFCEMYGWTEAEVLGRATNSLWPDCPAPSSNAPGDLSVDVTLATKDASELTVTLTRSMVHDDAGKVIAIVRVMRDVTERDRIERELRHANTMLERSRAAFEELALRDELTGLYNRRELVRRLIAEVARSSRTHLPFSLIMMDVDHFKSVNDRFGHPAGDAVLRRIARIVEEELRVSDTAARYGGEEIALLLPDTSAEDAARVAARLRARFESESFYVGEGTELEVTASFGVAAVPSHATTPAGLIAAADEALYAAKAEGRNRVVCSRTDRRAA